MVEPYGILELSVYIYAVSIPLYNYLYGTTTLGIPVWVLGFLLVLKGLHKSDSVEFVIGMLIMIIVATLLLFEFAIAHIKFI